MGAVDTPVCALALSFFESGGIVAVAIFVKPDRVYGEGVVRVRFSTDWDVPPSRIGELAAPVIKQAAAEFERQSGWQWIRQQDIHVYPSEMQASLDTFRTQGVSDPGLRTYVQGKRDWVAELWFRRPLDFVDPDLVREQREFASPKQGFVADEDMPERYKALREDPSLDPIANYEEQRIARDIAGNP